MSAKLRIPPQHFRPLKELVQLSQAERLAFIEAARKQDPTLNFAALGDKIAEASTLDPDTVGRILELLVSLHSAREGLDLSTQEFIAELRHAMEVLDKPKFELPPDGWSAFEETMTHLLSPDHSLALTAKASAIIREHSNVYFAGRILTDLRPVFGANVEDAPAALVTVHTLKIIYHHNMDDISEFFVALDRKDVLELIDLMQRALKKEEALRRLAADKHVEFLEVKP